MPDICNEERKTEQENQELLDEVTLEAALTNETNDAGDVEASSGTVEPAAVFSDSSKTAGEVTISTSEVTASTSSPSEEDSSEMPELLEKSIEEDDDDYVELKVEGSPAEQASLPTELQDSSLSLAASEASERPGMCSNGHELIIQEEVPVIKKQTDIEIQDSKGSGFLTMTASGSSATVLETTLSETTVQSDIDQIQEEGKKTANFAGETKSASDCPSNVSEAPATSEQKIAKLDVSSVASDTERLELKASANSEVPQLHRHVLEVIMYIVLLKFICTELK
jgi:hypothetical protein